MQASLRGRPQMVELVSQVQHSNSSRVWTDGQSSAQISLKGHGACWLLSELGQIYICSLNFVLSNLSKHREYELDQADSVIFGFGILGGGLVAEKTGFGAGFFSATRELHGSIERGIQAWDEMGLKYLELQLRANDFYAERNEPGH
nr:hypothetical protein Iba_chr07cCG9560 [Ipomoea batatas]